MAGYAYTHGYDGFSEGGWDAGPGEVIVALFSADGKTLNEEKHPRKWSTFLHTPPNPLVSGTILDASNKRFVVRIDDPKDSSFSPVEQWWIFDLESGKRIGALEPGQSVADKNSRGIGPIKAQAVPGTPLVLTHWWKL